MTVDEDWMRWMLSFVSLEALKQDLAQHREALADDCAHCGDARDGPRAHVRNDHDWRLYHLFSAADCLDLIEQICGITEAVGGGTGGSGRASPDPAAPAEASFEHAAE